MQNPVMTVSNVWSVKAIFPLFFLFEKKNYIGKNRRHTSFIRKKSNLLKSYSRKKKRKLVKIKQKFQFFSFYNELKNTTALFVKSTITTCMPTENKIKCHSIHPYKNLLTEVAIKNHFRVCVSTEEKEFLRKKIHIFFCFVCFFPSLLLNTWS